MLVLAGAAAAMPASADGVLDTLQTHGFVSQGFVLTDDNNLFGPSSDGGSLQFTEVGLNASLQPHSDVLIAAQVLSRRAGGDGRAARPRLDYAILDYQVHSDRNRHWGVQVGRPKIPLGLYNQTRDVAFTRPSILLPQSIYFDRTRSMALSSDGLVVYGEERMPSGALRWQIGAGVPQAEEDLAEAVFLDDPQGRFRGRPSGIAQLLYEHDGGRVIGAFSVGRLRAEFDSAAPELDGGQFLLRPWVLSLQYNAEQWSLTGEYALRESSLSGAGVAREFDVTGESAYVQYSRRFREDWQWLVRFDVLYADRTDRSGSDFETATDLPAHSRFAKDLTFGLQWQPHPQLLVAAEYHRVDGTGWLPRRDNPDAFATERRWDAFLLQTSLRF